VVTVDGVFGMNGGNVRLNTGMEPWIAPPVPLPWWAAPAVWLAERVAGRTLLAARVLARYPKAALSSMLFEALIAGPGSGLDARLLKLVRLQVSFAAACPFCADMNASHLAGVTREEVRALQAWRDQGLDYLPASIADRERLALAYVRAMTATPLKFDPGLRERLLVHFSERELVVLVYTAAQVNYWARLIQGLGIPPAGFCDLD
jgi:AhpD family alkylhydroperoxidase